MRHGKLSGFGVPSLLALGLGLWGITREHSMWRDEAATWQAAHRSLGELAHMVGQADVVHGLYYALMHGVFALFGDSLLTLRLPSVLAAATACGLTGLLGTRLAGHRVGMGAGLALAVVPAVQEQAQEGRSYALVLALVVLETWLFVEILARRGSWRWTWYAGTALFAAWLHWFSLLALVAHGVTLVCVRPGRAQWTRWGLAAAGAVVGTLPVILTSRTQVALVSWIAPLGWSTVLGMSGIIAFAALCARLSRGGPAGGAHHDGPGPGVSLAAVALPLCAVPQLSLALVSLVQPLYLTRYVLFTYVGLALLIGALLGTLGTRLRTPARVLLPATVALALLVLLPLELRLRTVGSRVDDVLTAATTVGRVRGSADGVLYVPAAHRDTALVSPGEFAGLRDLALAQSPVESGTLKGVEATPQAIERAMLGARRIVLVTDPGPQRSPSVRDLTKQRVLAERFTLRSDVVERGRRISVYERRPPDRPARHPDTGPLPAP